MLRPPHHGDEPCAFAPRVNPRQLFVADHTFDLQEGARSNPSHSSLAATVLSNNGKRTNTVELERLIEKTVKFFQEVGPGRTEIRHNALNLAADRSEDSTAALVLIGAHEANDAPLR